MGSAAKDLRVMARLDFIHVGDYKTGTSWLQKYGFSLHPEIHYLGDPFQNRRYIRLFHELIDARDLDFDRERLRQQFTDLLAREPSAGKKTGVSREVFSQTHFITGENARRNAERLRDVFGETRIIYVIREPISMLLSIYSQYVKMGGTLRLKDFVTDPIEAKGLINRLKYHKNVSMYYDLFGEENVHVDLYEAFSEDRASFLRRLYHFVGCTTTRIPESFTHETVNPSLSTAGCFAQRLLNRLVRNPYNPKGGVLPLQRAIALFLPRHLRVRLDEVTRSVVVPNLGTLDREARLRFAVGMGLTYRLERFASRVTFGKPLSLDNRIEQVLREELRASNRILLEQYGLPIDRYGWAY